MSALKGPWICEGKPGSCHVTSFSAFSRHIQPLAGSPVVITSINMFPNFCHQLPLSFPEASLATGDYYYQPANLRFANWTQRPKIIFREFEIRSTPPTHHHSKHQFANRTNPASE